MGRKPRTDGLRSRYMLRCVALCNEGKTNPEIAGELGIRPQDVAYLLHQARKRGFKIVARNLSYRERVRDKARGH